MIINHNMMAINTHRQMGAIQSSQGKSTEKLSSGLRINRAGDDAAGLAISEKMRGQIRGLGQASRNAQDTISLIQTAEGALNESHSILQRMRELAVQSANDTNTQTERDAIQGEVDQLTQEINRIATTTEFNTKKLLNGDLKGLSAAVDGTVEKEGTFENGNVALGAITGNVSALALTDVIHIKVTNEAAATWTQHTFDISATLGAGLTVTVTSAGITISDGARGVTLAVTNDDSISVGDTITLSVTKTEAAQTDGSKQVIAQIGANAGQTMGIGIDDMRSTSLGVAKADGTSLSVSTQGKAAGAIKLINNALEKVSTSRADLGAYQNRLEHTIANLDTSAENLQASESRIRDVDMAKEMMNFTKQNILQQAAQSMLAQANQAPQGVLSLLR